MKDNDVNENEFLYLISHVYSSKIETALSVITLLLCKNFYSLKNFG